jgi:hypothetical protein
MKIKVYVGPKEKAYYEEMLKIKMGDYYHEREIKPAIVESISEKLYDLIQFAPNGVEFTDEDIDFDEETANDYIEFLKGN